MNSANLPALLQGFFTERLCQQRQASFHTVAGYRDTFRLLLRFAQQRLGKAPSKLGVEDIDARFIGDFLSHLEKDRGRHGVSRPDQGGRHKGDQGRGIRQIGTE